MKKVVLAVLVVFMLSGNAFSMGFFPTTPPAAPALPPASREGVNDWKPSIDSSPTLGTIYHTWSPSKQVLYGAYTKPPQNAYRTDDYSQTRVDYDSFWDTFGGFF